MPGDWPRLPPPSPHRSGRFHQPPSSPWRAAIVRDDRGYATVLAAGVIVALVALVSVVVYGSQLLWDDHRAQVAADAAALAGAYEAYVGRDGCAAARTIASRNGGTVTECIVRGGDVTVATCVGGRQALSTAGPTR
ncbi:Rv3654c family TadE-like protein [Corynebacterium pyruviciproducens]|uniref:Rv3654c family TadE-like protein n=1 Tax=Corynebacterium pyruviciproducens TaxID=598660 RepID=UPI0025515ED2|nr:Rv3654c family TadE-like protein [Corynebacterium pyruviciproducens]MDK6566167.1 flp pilus-assembly TadE/G-like family protein [Corynebacterium pyruviciproducens]MDK7214631.1 flp pilus-assembly TadE/G-like family protein [Corynebacterium pyruviciproducens]